MMDPDLPADYQTTVEAIARAVGIPDPRWLMVVLHHESRHKPDIVYGGKSWGSLTQAERDDAEKRLAVGLIQFMPSTRRALGVTAAGLAAMSRTQQLAYVAKYLEPYRGRLQTPIDVAAAVFFPAAIGHGPQYLVGVRGELNTEGKPSLRAKAYDLNKSLDKDSNGKITMLEYVTVAGSSARRYGVVMDVAEKYLNAVKASKYLSDIVNVALMIRRENPKNAELQASMEKLIHTMQKIGEDFPAGMSSPVVMSAKPGWDPVDYRLLAENRIRIAFDRPTSFEPTLTDYKGALIQTAVDVKEKTVEAAEKVGGALPYIALGAAAIATIVLVKR